MAGIFSLLAADDRVGSHVCVCMFVLVWLKEWVCSVVWGGQFVGWCLPCMGSKDELMVSLSLSLSSLSLFRTHTHMHA